MEINMRGKEAEKAQLCWRRLCQSNPTFLANEPADNHLKPMLTFASIWRLFPLLLHLFLFLAPCWGIVCRKERVSALGINDIRGGLNVDCGQYVQHCLKVQQWDGTIIRDCDPLALCPKDGSKMIRWADYFCCFGDLCNGQLGRGSGILAALFTLLAPSLTLIFSLVLL